VPTWKLARRAAGPCARHPRHARLHRHLRLPAGVSVPREPVPCRQFHAGRHVHNPGLLVRRGRGAGRCGFLYYFNPFTCSPADRAAAHRRWHHPLARRSGSGALITLLCWAPALDLLGRFRRQVALIPLDGRDLRPQILRPDPELREKLSLAARDKRLPQAGGIISGNSRRRYVTALDDVSFELVGDRLGLVGSNGGRQDHAL